MTSSKNLPIMYKKEVTAVVAHSLTEDDLTHPGLYRSKRNLSPYCASYQSVTNEIKPENKTSSGNANWDLYPSLIRNIENEGTPEQVERLHRMQKNLS